MPAIRLLIDHPVIAAELAEAEAAVVDDPEGRAGRRRATQLHLLCDRLKYAACPSVRRAVTGIHGAERSS